MTRNPLIKVMISISLAIVVVVLVGCLGIVRFRHWLEPETLALYLVTRWWPWITHSAGVVVFSAASILRLKQGRTDSAGRFACGALVLAGLLLALMFWVDSSFPVTHQDM